MVSAGPSSECVLQEFHPMSKREGTWDHTLLVWCLQLDDKDGVRNEVFTDGEEVKARLLDLIASFDNLEDYVPTSEIEDVREGLAVMRDNAFGTDVFNEAWREIAAWMRDCCAADYSYRPERLSIPSGISIKVQCWMLHTESDSGDCIDHYDNPSEAHQHTCSFLEEHLGDDWDGMADFKSRTDFGSPDYFSAFYALKDDCSATYNYISLTHTCFWAVTAKKEDELF